MSQFPTRLARKEVLRVLIEKADKRKAKSNGEDLLTPTVQQAAEAIVAVIPQPTR